MNTNPETPSTIHQLAESTARIAIYKAEDALERSKALTTVAPAVKAEVARELAILRRPAYGLTKDSPHKPISLFHQRELQEREIEKTLHKIRE